MSKGKRLGLIGLIVLISVSLDQITKYLAVYLLEGKGLISLVNDCLRFVLVQNRGGFLSLGAALPENLRSMIFIFATSVFLLLFLAYIFFTKNQSTVSIAASSMIIGGGIGNLIDRVLYDGAVIDFVNVGIGSLRTGVFNVADMAVLFGCIMLVLTMKRENAAVSPGKSEGTSPG